MYFTPTRFEILSEGTIKLPLVYIDRLYEYLLRVQGTVISLFCYKFGLIVGQKSLFPAGQISETFSREYCLWVVKMKNVRENFHCGEDGTISGDQ